MFSYDDYKKLLADIKSSGKYVLKLEEAMFADEFLLLRHDIEFSIARAYALSTIEAEAGISSNYFVQVTNNAYNPFSKYNSDMLKKMQESGHIIGLHYHMNGETDPCVMEEQIMEQADVLSRLCGLNVTTFSIHRPSKTALAANIMPKGLVNAYCRELFTFKDETDWSDAPLNVKYVADSRHNWNYAAPWTKPCREMFDANKKVQLLVHPYSWTPDGKDSLENFRSLLAEDSAEHIETINSECKHFSEIRSQL